MKVTIQNKTLLAAVKQLLPICPKNGFLPSLEYLYLRVFEGGNLNITGSDSEITGTICIENRFPAAEPGDVLINAKKLAEILSALPHDLPVCIECNSTDTLATITSGLNASASYKMPVDDASMYPAAADHLEQDADNPHIIMPASVLKKALSATTYAASKDDLRPAMTGVCLQFMSNKTEFVATDGFKLSLFEAWGIGTKTDMQVILPAKAAQVILRAEPTGSDSFVSLYLHPDKNQLCLQTGNFYLSSVLIDANFPNYRAVMPADNPVEIMLFKDDLAEGIKRACLFSNKINFEVCLTTIEQDTLNITAQDVEAHLQSEENIACDTTGPGIQIALNGKSVLECLNSLSDAPQIKLLCSEPHRAILIIDPDENSDTRITTLLMPIMKR